MLLMLRRLCSLLLPRAPPTRPTSNLSPHPSLLPTPSFHPSHPSLTLPTHPSPFPPSPFLSSLTSPSQAFFLLREHTLLSRQGTQLAQAVAEDVEDLQAALVKIADDKVRS